MVLTVSRHHTVSDTKLDQITERKAMLPHSRIIRESLGAPHGFFSFLSVQVSYSQPISVLDLARAIHILQSSIIAELRE